MSVERNIQILKESEAFLEGHFILSSGKHSGGYCQCAHLLRFPDKAAEVLKDVADQLRGLEFDKLCGPAMGGIIVSYELGRQLGKEAIFTERVDNVMTLKRFTVNKGDRIIITEDVITTGKSTLETVKALEDAGAVVIGLACIADRRAPDCDFPLPVYSAVKLDITTHEADNCPLCKEGKLKAVKPGSRKM